LIGKPETVGPLLPDLVKLSYGQKIRRVYAGGNPQDRSGFESSVEGFEF
jgi:hypothetical protein